LFLVITGIPRPPAILGRAQGQHAR